jgi:hypothetical protein
MNAIAHLHEALFVAAANAFLSKRLSHKSSRRYAVPARRDQRRPHLSWGPLSNRAPSAVARSGREATPTTGYAEVTGLIIGSSMQKSLIVSTLSIVQIAAITKSRKLLRLVAWTRVVGAIARRMNAFKDPTCNGNAPSDDVSRGFFCKNCRIYIAVLASNSHSARLEDRAADRCAMGGRSIISLRKAEPMPESATGRFTDAEDYLGGLPVLAARLVVTEVGSFAAGLTRAKLPNMHLVSAQEALARVAYVSLPAGSVFVSFPTRRVRGMFWNGCELAMGDVVFHARGEQFYQRTSGVCHWGFIAISSRFFARYGGALAGSPLAPPIGGQIVRPLPVELKRLVGLHARVARLVETRPVSVGDPEISRALEHELLHDLVNCLTGRNFYDGSLPSPDHVRGMLRLEAVLQEHVDRNIRLHELCELVDFSKETLMACCPAFLGVSPLRYLRLRQMLRVHRRP